MALKIIREYIAKIAYPPGCIYATNNSLVTVDTLAEAFGGTWRLLENTFLLSEDSAHILGNSYGSRNSILPSHYHPSSHGHNALSFSHSHRFKGDKACKSGTDYGQMHSYGSGSETTGHYLTSYTGDHNHGNAFASQSTSTTSASGASSVTDGNMPPYYVVHFFTRVD